MKKLLLILLLVGCSTTPPADSDPDARRGVSRFDNVDLVSMLNEHPQMTVEGQQCRLYVRDGLAAFGAWGVRFGGVQQALYEQIVSLDLAPSMGVIDFHTFNMESAPGERVYWVMCNQETMAYTYSAYDHQDGSVVVVPLALAWWCGP